MPRVYNRTSNRGSWTQETLQNAIRAILEDNMKIREAGRVFNIPEGTLRRRLVSKNFEKRNMGPSSCLGRETELKLVKHIGSLQAAGFAPTRDTVRKIAFNLADMCKIPNKFNKEKKIAGRDWYRSFMERNVCLSVRKAEGISVPRAQGMNREEVHSYFDLLATALLDNGLIAKPSNVFNVDETGLQLNNKPGNIVVIKGSRDVQVITSGEKGETISVIACCNAEGNFLPPYCIFKGVNKKAEFSDGMPPGSMVTMSKKSAYVTSDIFMDWLQNHFTPRKPSGKTLIILDGHSSHMNCYQMLEFAAENDIVLLCLPSHTTHYLQPLDRTFFKPLKTYFYQACGTWMVKNENRKLNRLQFGKLLCEAWSRAATTGIGVAGFRACGIFPLDRSAVPDRAFNVSDIASLNSQPSSSSVVAESETSAATSRSLPPTPNKALQEVSPIPKILKPATSRRKQSATLITDSSYIEERKKRAKSTVQKDKGKHLPVPKLAKRKLVFKKKRISSDESTADSTSDSETEDDECVQCLEQYEETKSNADWIKCILCCKWLHETCSAHVNLCSVCGRKEKRRLRDEKRAVQ